MFKNKLTNISAVVAGGTATLTIGTGKNAPTLDKLRLTLGGAAFNASKVNRIRGYVNGSLVYSEGSGTVHNARRTYLGATVAASGIVLDFTEPNARSAIEQNLSSWPLAMMQACSFEFDIDATAGADATMRCVASFRAPTNNPFIKKFKQTTAPFAGGGEQIVYVPSAVAGGKLVRAWIHESVPGNITAVELRAKNAVGIESTRAEIEADQVDAGLTPQAGVLCLDFIEDGNLAGWFDTAALSEVELRLTGAAAATYTIYYEYLDPIGRL